MRTEGNAGIQRARFLIVILTLFSFSGLTEIVWAQSVTITTTSRNFQNQFHRNLLGGCSVGSIDCGPNTAATTDGTAAAFTTNIRALPTDPTITCVAGAFGEAAGNAPGATPGNADNCLTTAGLLWPGSLADPRCDVPAVRGTAPACLAQFSDRFAFTGLPRIPTGADTQFGTGTPGAAPLALTGTVSAGAAGLTVTGTSTLFTTELVVGDIIIVGGHVKRVRAITSATSLTVDTQFETAVAGGTAISKSDRTFTNVMDIGGAGNNSVVPAGSSAGTIAFTIQRSFQDVPIASCTATTTGAGLPTPTVCNSGFDLTSSAPAPSNIPGGTCIGGACPANFVGNRFRSAVEATTATGNCAGGLAITATTPCRKNEIEYGFTMKFVNAIVSSDLIPDCVEGNTLNPAFGLCDRGRGDNMQEMKASFRVISFTDGNGNLIGNPTGFYFHELNSVAATDVNSAAARTLLSTETGAFRTTVTFPGTLPSIALELDQTTPFDFVVDDGCPHDSGGATCSPRVSPGDSLLP